MMICNVINSLMGLLVMGLYVGVLFLNSTHCICPSCINTECIKLYSVHVQCSLFSLWKGRETRRVGCFVHCTVFCYFQEYRHKLPSPLKGRKGSSLACEALLGIETNLFTLVFLNVQLDYYCRGRWNGSSLTRHTAGCRWTLTGEVTRL